MSETAPLSDRDFALVAKALSDPRRYRILAEIAAARVLPCQSMCEKNLVSAATISHHVKELEAAGLIEIVRAGKFATLHFCADRMTAYRARITASLNLPP